MSVIGPQHAPPDLAQVSRAPASRPALERQATPTHAETQAKAQAARLLELSAALNLKATTPATSESPADGFDLSARQGVGGRGLNDVFGSLFRSAKEAVATTEAAVQKAPVKVGGAAEGTTTAQDTAVAQAKPAAPTPDAGATTSAPKVLLQPALPAAHGDIRYAPIEGGKLFAKGTDDAHAIDPSDIRQGIAEDCWLLASLATIAMGRPELIERNIRDLGDGTFEVTLFQKVEDALFGAAKTFEKVRVVVDGELPTYAGIGARAYAEAVEENGTPELWSAIYEKAVAHHLGGYTGFSNRAGADGLELISGGIANQHIASELEFSQVAEWFKKGDGLAVVSMPADLAPEFEAYRDGTLMAEHIYYVSDVDTASGTVEIRNPFGWDHAPIRMPWDTFKHTLGWIDHGQLPE